jgi:hypothetical protein
MIVISSAHGQLQTSVEGGAPPAEIARIFNATAFQLSRLSKRLQR